MTHRYWLLIPLAVMGFAACASTEGDDDDDSAGPIIEDPPDDSSVWDDLSLGFNVTLNAMWGSSSQSLWIVGDGGAIYHWNGTNWTATPSGTISDINGVWGTGDGSSVWAVGDAGVVVSWDEAAGAWSSAEFPFVSNLTGIKGFSADEVFVSGYGGLFAWDGVEWTVVELPENVALRSVWGSTPQDLWLVGEEGMVFHGGGNTWEVVETGVTSTLNTVGSDGTSVWIAGEGGLLMKHEGGSFVADAVLEQENNLWSVWGGGGTLFVAGANGHVDRWNGTEWEGLDTGEDRQVVLYSLFGFSINDLYAVGGNGTILHYPKTGAPADDTGEGE